MAVLHYLFWIRNGMVTTLCYDKGEMRMLKIGGLETVPLTDSFWDDWKEYAGKCRDDRIDFCLIYDEEPAAAEALRSEQCDFRDCTWSRAKIEKAVKMLALRESIDICDEHGALLFKAGNSLGMKKEKAASMTARWRGKTEQAVGTADISFGTMTPMKKHYKAELKAVRGE